MMSPLYCYSTLIPLSYVFKHTGSKMGTNCSFRPSREFPAHVLVFAGPLFPLKVTKSMPIVMLPQCLLILLLHLQVELYTW